MLDGILGDGDAAGAQPPRQGGDQATRRIAGQRIDEFLDRCAMEGEAQLAAALTWAMSSIGRISTQLVVARVRCGQSRAIASASAASLASITK